MPKVHEWSIPGSDGQAILGNAHLPDQTPRGVLLIAHGFKGYMDYGFMPRLADLASQAGLIAHRFNFSHSGMTRAFETFERPDLFEQDTWSKQVYDLSQIVGAVEQGELAGKGLPIVLFGHSRGGVTSLLAASRLGERVAGVIAAAAPDYTCNLDEATREMLHRVGRLPSPSGRTGQELMVGKGWLEEIEAVPDAFDPKLAIAKITRPIALIHGSGDTTVPVEAAHALHAANPSHSTLSVLDGASHVFDAPNPLPPKQDLPPATKALLDQTIEAATAWCNE